MPAREKLLPDVIVPSREEQKIQITRYHADKIGDYAQRVKSEHDDFTPKGIETPLSDAAQRKLAVIALSRSMATHQEFTLPVSES